MIVRKMLADGAFNTMYQISLPDGSVDVTLTRRGDPNVYRMIVCNLYQPDERVIKEEVTPWSKTSGT